MAAVLKVRQAAIMVYNIYLDKNFDRGKVAERGRGRLSLTEEEPIIYYTAALNRRIRGPVWTRKR